MVFFRSDANSVISGGHIMRCLAIAKSAMSLGMACCFLVADENPVEILQEHEIPFVILHSDWQDLSGEIDKVREILKHERDPILLIDTYSVTKSYVDALRPYACIAYLGSKRESLGKLDLLINYSTDIDYDFYQEAYGKETTLLLGPAYAPLRDEFHRAAAVVKQKAERILLTTGNSDPLHIVPELLRALLPALSGQKILLECVVGRFYDNREQLFLEFDGCASVILHENMQSMSELMKRCDIAVSANGTTVYELSAIGLPVISFALTEEQVRSAEALSELGVIDYCGRAYEDKTGCVASVVNQVLRYLAEPEARLKLAERAHSFIDGRGCQRITDALNQLRPMSN